MGEQLISGAVRALMTFMSSPSYKGTSIKFVAHQNNYNNNSKDHWLQIVMTDNNGKAWNNARITIMWCKNLKQACAVGKMVPVDLLDVVLPQTYNLKNKQTNKKKPACEAK